MERNNHTTDEERRAAYGWCPKCGCGSDALGYAHLPTCPTLKTTEIERLRAENESLRSDVIAFCGSWAATYARERGLPDGHFYSVHYDILARAGARMDSFTRSDES